MVIGWVVFAVTMSTEAVFEDKVEDVPATVPTSGGDVARPGAAVWPATAIAATSTKNYGP